jgi:exodeoxyribonuclease VII, large subunit
MNAESGDGESVGAINDLGSLSAELDTDSLTFVDSLNTEIAGLVETTPALEYEYVLGDVSDYGTSSNGHAHFDLVHEDSTLHCVVFRSRLARLQDELEDGTLAAVNGDISYYESEGSVSLIVRDVVAVGQGTYQQTYRENKQTLAQDGCLDEDAKQPVPPFPRRVGIATSSDSDAREDAVTSVHDRHPDVDIVVQDTSVQGENAMLSMMDAVSTLDDDARVDVIALTRGGGAEKHLRVFNETPLCRVVHETTTPIVVGVGHETDRTLAAEVADRRVMTPTEVGEIVPREEELQERVEQLSTDLECAYTETVEETLETRRDRLEIVYRRHVTDELGSLSSRLDRAHETLEREKAYEREKADAVRSYQHTTRRQRLIIVTLVILLVATLALLFLSL